LYQSLLQDSRCFDLLLRLDEDLAKVDVATEQGLRARVRDRVIAEAVSL
jgi:predicted nucleotidyltransferase